MMLRKHYRCGKNHILTNVYVEEMKVSSSGSRKLERLILNVLHDLFQSQLFMMHLKMQLRGKAHL
jgi:hypothetical protein